ncbi:MAG TPA: DUF3566 domain-containing protein [Candidatus Lumbricidophila sp.]|nr:DUF3566 domain-containing protein [Candidatus Lumbricidophila sp.]
MSSIGAKLAQKSSKKLPAKQVRLRLVYIDFWTSLKLSFLVAVCFAIVNIVGTFLIYTVLKSTLIFDKINALVTDIGGAEASIDKLLSLGNVMGFSVVVALVNLIVITVVGALIAVLYNLSARITGGVLVGFTNN